MNQLLSMLASLKITLLCLIWGLILVFISTLAQVEMGIFAVKAIFYDVFFVKVPIGGFNVPVFPGGFLIGLLLLINMSAAFLVSFRYIKKKAGILMIHLGLIFLVLGTLLTAVQQIETSMEITEGETAIYSFDQRDSELIIAYEVDADNEQVVAIPESIYSERKEFNDLKDIPFTFKVKQYYPNTNFFRTEKADMVSAQNGVGTSLMVTKKAKTLKDDELNAPSVIIEVFEDGKSRGTWLLSNLLGAPQKIQVKGKDYRIAIRQRRYYNDFEMKLIDFSHDRYAGTNTPKNFSSDVVITRPDEEAFEYRVYMNHPLRIDGRTYYQASFKDNDTTTIFQVVKNPSWLIPYWSCTIISLGLVVQFMMHLIKFLKKREAKL